MRKIALFLSALCFTLLASCGGNTPSAVAEKAYNCLIDEDAEGFVDLMYVNEDEDPDMVEAGKQMMVAALKGQLKKAKESGKMPVKVKAIEEEINEDGDRATVELEVEDEDGNTDTETVKLRKDESGKWRIVAGK